MTKRAKRSFEFQQAVAVEYLKSWKCPCTNGTQKHETIQNYSEPLAQPRYVKMAVQMDLTGEDIEVTTEAKVVQSNLSE